MLLAGTLKDLVVHHRWIMYSLFIGLTLGGLPVVWRLARPASASLVFAAVIAFLLMLSLAVLQAMNVMGSSGSNFALFFFAGLAGASAMILPGLSGGYLLLLMGQYVPILSAIDQFKVALKSHDLAAAIEPALTVLLPVGLGVVAGVVAVGNLLQWLLQSYRKATLGALLGLLIGSTVGLWPFQRAVPPAVGETIKGQIVSAETIGQIDPEDWPTEFFRPQPGEIAAALLMVAIGCGLTVGIASIGSQEHDDGQART